MRMTTTEMDGDIMMRRQPDLRGEGGVDFPHELGPVGGLEKRVPAHLHVALQQVQLLQHKHLAVGGVFQLAQP